jgi:outer membrane protein TolC
LQQLDNAKRNLNLIMGVEIETLFTLVEKLEMNETIQKNAVVSAALENNVRIASVNSSTKISEHAIGLAKSSWMPGLGASAGYNYRGTDDPNGAFLTGSSSSGPTAGLSLNWNLFDFKNKNRVENARLNLESSKIEAEATKQRVKLDALNAHATYQNAIFVMNAQQENVSTAQNNFERSEESYKIGNITSVEYRQAQVNLLNAQLQLSQAKYNAKNAELNVLALMGLLLNQ